MSIFVNRVLKVPWYKMDIYIGYSNTNALKLHRLLKHLVIDMFFFIPLVHSKLIIVQYAFVTISVNLDGFKRVRTLLVRFVLACCRYITVAKCIFCEDMSTLSCYSSLYYSLICIVVNWAWLDRDMNKSKIHSVRYTYYRSWKLQLDDNKETFQRYNILRRSQL